MVTILSEQVKRSLLYLLICHKPSAFLLCHSSPQISIILLVFTHTVAMIAVQKCYITNIKKASSTRNYILSLVGK